MQRWLEFMQHHPILFGILAVCAVAFFLIEGRRSGAKISPQSLGAFMNANKPIVVDLRDAKDFKLGHISGSRNIPFASINNHVAELNATPQSIVFVCNIGQVAGSAAKLFDASKVFRLDGGIQNWKSNGLPLVKGK